MTIPPNPDLPLYLAISLICPGINPFGDSLGAILALATCAMLCGARSLYAIAQWGRDQGGATAQLLGFSQEKTPCVAKQ